MRFTKLTCFNLFLCFLLVISAIFSASAQKTKPVGSTNQFKQLAGSAEEISAMRLPAAETTGVNSKTAMIPIYAGDSGRTIEIPVDSPENFKLMLLAPNSGDWQINAALPSQNFVNLRSKSENLERVSTSYGLDGNAYPAEVFKFDAVKAGTLRVQIGLPRNLKDSGKAIGYLVASGDSRYRLYSYVDTYETLVGREIGIVTSLFDNLTITEKGVQTALVGNVRESNVRIISSKGEIIDLPMTDLGDGNFRGNFVPTEGGQYTAQITVRGITPEGNEFLRTSEQIIEVASTSARIGKGVRVSTVDGLRNQISVPVAGLNVGQKVIANAEVWGRDVNGNEQSIAWIGGMALAERRPASKGVSVGLTLDSRWLARVGFAGNYELRNLRIQDPDTSVVLGHADNLALPSIFVNDYAKSFGGEISSEMREGVRPTKLQQNAVGGKLMLVHGYCSGDAWGSVAAAGQFTNYVKFLDLNQNRSHDQFANLIRNFGASLPSYGIVAHSQGGAASLHLYTYYWSGLDYATGGSRLIQSVGTPYQGTALAGNLAILGQIFGAGCGSNYDLSYSGAAAWLANIPTWARAKVYYHTTSFTDVWWRYDYCSLATDLFLNDPDDGVTEQAYDQLIGGNNMGHKTGWCHTSGMRDPAQTGDSARNSTMNSTASR